MVNAASSVKRGKMSCITTGKGRVLSASKKLSSASQQRAAKQYERVLLRKVALQKAVEEDEEEDDEEEKVPAAGGRYSDEYISRTTATDMDMKQETVLKSMKMWKKSILWQHIPGKKGRRLITYGMLTAAQRRVINFFNTEERKGENSDVVKAFELVAGEKLRFCWDEARKRVMGSQVNYNKTLHGWRWGKTYAMTSGNTNATGVIYLSGHRALSTEALTSLICHEGLHNFVKRDRPGNPWLTTHNEHLAMIFLGDPQLGPPAD